MVEIYNYTGSFPIMGSTTPASEEYRKSRFSLFAVMDLYTDKNDAVLNNDTDEAIWKVNATTTHTNKRECMVFYSWDSMRFFAMNRESGDGLGAGYTNLFGTPGNWCYPKRDLISVEKPGGSTTKTLAQLFKYDIEDAKTLDDMLKNRKDRFEKYNTDAFRNENTDYYLNELNKFLIDAAEKLNNWDTMTRAFYHSDINMVLSPSAMEPFKWAELPSTNYSSPGSLGFSENKMTGGDISAEVLSLVHLLEYRNAVNKNFVNNVLPTLKGGALPSPIAVDSKTPVDRNVTANILEPENIERELVNYITNTQTDLTLYNRLTEFAKDPSTAEEMRSYLNRIAKDVAKAEGIRKLIEADRSLLKQTTWDKIREKVGKYGTRAATVGNKLKNAIQIILGPITV